MTKVTLPSIETVVSSPSTPGVRVFLFAVCQTVEFPLARHQHSVRSCGATCGI